MLLSLSLAALAASPAVAATCLPDAGGYLRARLRGDVELDIDWREPALVCTGMPRPDGEGIRLRFSAALPDGGTLAFVFAPPELPPGRDARAVPVNVTVLQESAGRIYGTRGEQRCLLDDVKQEKLSEPPAGAQSWIVAARGFCTEPARALDDSGAVLLTRFDFRGRVDVPATAPGGDPASGTER